MAHDQVAPWLTPATVKSLLPGTTLDATGELPADVELCRQAAAAYVERERRDLVEPAVLDANGAVVTPARFVPTADVLVGAALLTSRLHARKGSPQGLVGFGEFGPAPVLRVDPDVDRLLGIGRSRKPVAK